MRVLVISRPTSSPPKEALVPLMNACADWQARHKSMMESFDCFVAGGSGCGIVNTPDDHALAQMMMEFPWAPYSDVAVHLLTEGDVALQQVRDYYRQQVSAGR